MIIKKTHAKKNFNFLNEILNLQMSYPQRTRLQKRLYEMFNVCFPELFFGKSIQKPFSEYITLGRIKFEFEQDLPSLYRPAR